MSPLRRRMIEDMTVRNLSPYTQRNYLFAVSRFVRHVRREHSKSWGADRAGLGSGLTGRG
jgi:hypothetical protein